MFAAWVNDALEVKQLRSLLKTLLTSFVGTEPGTGFFGRIDEQALSEALAQLHPFSLELGAGLTAAAMSSGWRTEIYEWQPVLRRAIEMDVILVGDWSVRVLERLRGKGLAPADISELFDDRIAYVDDETWCERLAKELELGRISMDLHRRAKVRSAVMVEGAGDPLTDVRLLSVARRFLDFKKVPAVAVIPDEGTILILEPEKSARAMVAHRLAGSSGKPVSIDRLREIEEQGGTWADLIGSAESEAA